MTPRALKRLRRGYKRHVKRHLQKLEKKMADILETRKQQKTGG